MTVTPDVDVDVFLSFDAERMLPCEHREHPTNRKAHSDNCDTWYVRMIPHCKGTWITSDIFVICERWIDVVMERGQLRCPACEAMLPLNEAMVVVGKTSDGPHL